MRRFLWRIRERGQAPPVPCVLCIKGQLGDPCICLAADEQDLGDDVLTLIVRLHGQPLCRAAVLGLDVVAEDLFLTSLRGGQDALGQ